MAASFAVRQSKTILAEVGFCDALAAERGGQSTTNLDMNTLTLCPFILDCLNTQSEHRVR